MVASRAGEGRSLSERLAKPMTAAPKVASDYVWALKDINFEVMPGEVLGIIGKNGAGKSTLLKILSKVTGPTTGRIDFNGRIGSLLEVGTGFHPDLTGRENIFLNGAILGMTKREIYSKLDEIIDFSGCERYIDTPVKRYSSGMTVRLGFAVAAHLDPEILIVDEVLAVGDAEFQKKAIGKMQDVSRNEGRTVLFVSHNMGAVEKLCTNLLIVDQGSISYNGRIHEGINEYLRKEKKVDGTIVDEMSFCHTDLTINSVTINSSESNVLYLKNNTEIKLIIAGLLHKSKKMSVEVRLLDSRDNPLIFFSPGHVYGKIDNFNEGKFYFTEIFVLPNNISKGEFYLSIALTLPNVETYFHSYVKVISNGIESVSEVELNYNDRGLLILK
jgi:lipopolysaccharide transport system ATP-binding protein